MRAVVLLAALLVAAALPAAARACAPSAGGLELQRATIPEIQLAMREGRLTSAMLTEAYLARIAAYDASGPRLSSVRHVAADARAQAARLDAERAAGNVRGPLHGIPVLLKDNVATADMPTTAGALALEGAVPERDATITAKLRAAGAVILGKANLSEFAGWVDLDAPPGWSSLGGQVLNAYDFTATPSGSSAGSGAATSMALSGASIGTETSGSILSPSEANGIVGVKTTLGLASTRGILPLAPSFDVPGPMTRSVVDAALVLGAMDERESDYAAGLAKDALKGARLAYSNGARDSLSGEERDLFDAAIARAERLGATVTGVDALEAGTIGAAEIGAIPNEFNASLNAYLSEELPDARFDTLAEIVAFNDTIPDRYPHGQDLLRASSLTPGQEALYPAADVIRASARAAVDAALAEGDAEAILTPGNVHANIGAAAGYPTVLVPLGYSAGGLAPEGLGFMGPAFSEARLLALAYAYEQDAAVRVPPETVNDGLVPGTCPAPAEPAAEPLPRLRVRAKVRGRRLRIRVRGALARRVRVVVRRGDRVIARRRIRRGAVVRARVRRAGRYRVTVLDPGPPPRARSRRVRVR